MKKHINIFLIIVFVISATGFYSFESVTASIKKLHWLRGKWSRVSSGVEQFESWRIVKDSLLEGDGYSMKTNNKKITETLSIKYVNKKLVYIADVSENKGPVTFENTLLNDTVAVFENKVNDYPNKITYIKISKRSYKVILDDNKGTNTRSMTFKLVTKR